MPQTSALSHKTASWRWTISRENRIHWEAKGAEQHMKTALIAWLLLIIGCPTSPMARLSVTKDAYSQWPNYCKTALTLTNLLLNRTIRPVVVLLVYDLAGNALDQPTTNFDVIQPGQFQTKEALISANCGRIAKVHVYRAYEPDAESAGHYHPLIGVHEVTYSFTR
jgi:hypothetical protein